MRIDKAQVLDILRELGHDTTQAERDLPDQVDTDEHAGLLGKYGISGSELLAQFGGGDAGRDGGNDDDGDGGTDTAQPHDAVDEFSKGLPAGAAGLRGIGVVGGGGR